MRGRLWFEALALAASVACWAGCPAAPDDDDTDDTGGMTLAGTVTNDDGVGVPDTIGVALLWDLEPWGFLDGSKRIAEETAVSAPWPAAFELAAAAPPDAARFTLEEVYVEPADDPTVRLSTGQLLGYADGDGDGALSLLGPADMAIVDVVVGVGGAGIYYLDGDTPLVLDGWLTVDGGALTLQPGANLVRLTLDGLTVLFDPLSLDHDIALPLIDDPSLSYLLCPDGNHNIASHGSDACDGDDPPDDCPDLEALPADAEVECSDDGLELTVTTRTEDRVNACESMTSYVDYTWTLGQADDPPPGWPC